MSFESSVADFQRKPNRGQSHDENEQARRDPTERSRSSCEPRIQRVARHRVRCVHEAGARDALDAGAAGLDDAGVRGEDGKEFGFTGSFREVVKPSRIVHTEIYDPGDIGGDMGGEALVISEFAPEGDGTLHTMTIRYGSKEDRDAAFKSGMTDGMEMGYVRLDAILAGTGG
jgi:uncharacterized protein YndB with AHSA1/START domain